jgi:hypothetical protein
MSTNKLGVCYFCAMINSACIVEVLHISSLLARFPICFVLSHQLGKSRVILNQLPSRLVMWCPSHEANAFLMICSLIHFHTIFLLSYNKSQVIAACKPLTSKGTSRAKSSCHSLFFGISRANSP